MHGTSDSKATGSSMDGNPDPRPSKGVTSYGRTFNRRRLSRATNHTVTCRFNCRSQGIARSRSKVVHFQVVFFVVIFKIWSFSLPAIYVFSFSAVLRAIITESEPPLGVRIVELRDFFLLSEGTSFVPFERLLVFVHFSVGLLPSFVLFIMHHHHITMHAL